MWVSESELKLKNYNRALFLSSSAIERHCALKTTVTLEKPLFLARQGIFEHLVEDFETSTGDDEVEMHIAHHSKLE